MSGDIHNIGRIGAAPGQAKALVIFLHGYGANGADLLDIGAYWAADLPRAAFVAPDAPEPCRAGGPGFQWFPIPWMDGSAPEAAEASRQASGAALRALIAREAAAYGLPLSAVALFGFSQGAMMALEVAPRLSAPLGGVIAASGRLWAAEGLAATPHRPPVLLLHGQADPVVPFTHMGEAEAALKAAGFAVTARAFPGLGHGIAPEGLAAAQSFLRAHLPGAAFAP